MDTGLRFRVNNRNRYALKHAEGNEALFVVNETIIFEGIGGAFEYLLRINEVETVVFEIMPAFRLIPGKSHSASV